MRRTLWALALAAAASGPAQAQRAGENPLAAARDAFGTTVGTESIGLYTARDVRGFDPVQASNVRLEGLYFDRQAPPPNEIFNSRLVTGSSIKVGLTAQSYPFPAPTGIADVTLRIPGDTRVASVFAGYGPYNKSWAEIDTQLPVVKEKLSVGGGFGWMEDHTPYHSRPMQWTFGALARWRPSDKIEIIPFWSRKDTVGLNARPNIFATGSFVPPELTQRDERYVQPWIRNRIADSDYGVIVNTALSDDWLVRAGLFRSIVYWRVWSNNLFNTNANGLADNILIVYPQQEFGSVSGELRVSHVITDGDWRHTFHVALRGRDVLRITGGSSSQDLGVAPLGQVHYVAPRTFTTGPESRDRAQQGTGGVAYNGSYGTLADVSLGIQKSTYSRRLTIPNAPDSTLNDNPWLPNATLAVHPLSDLTVFGSYTRGFEENGQAPNNAVNRGEGVPASRTSQVDAGVRYVFTPGISAVVTAFEIKKPYFNLDARSVFTHVGELSHKGVEMSFTARVGDGLTIVGGNMFLKARITGDLVSRGVIGPIPMGRIPRVTRGSVEYGPKAWDGVSLDTQIESLAAHVGSLDNKAIVPARFSANVGARYRFVAYHVPAQLRFQVQNATNVFGYDVNAQQLSFDVFEPRRYMLSLTADF